MTCSDDVVFVQNAPARTAGAVAGTEAGSGASDGDDEDEDCRLNSERIVTCGTHVDGPTRLRGVARRRRADDVALVFVPEEATPSSLSATPSGVTVGAPFLPFLIVTNPLAPNG